MCISMIPDLFHSVAPDPFSAKTIFSQVQKFFLENL